KRSSTAVWKQYKQYLVFSGFLMHIGRKIFSTGFKLFDLLLMMFSFAVATLPLYHRVGKLSLAEFFEMRVKLGNLILFISFAVIWHILFSVFGLYGSRRLNDRWD